MPSTKRLGFFWGEEKATLVEFEKNAPIQVIVSPLGSKTSALSPFSSNLTEEIQITATLKKILQDNNISGGSFYVSLPLKEIILRSFVLPYVKPDELFNAVKFEAKKYVPFDMQELSYVYHAVPFTEGDSKRLQVIFYAVRKEALARYERIFQQLNLPVACSEPYMVSLAKALLFRKEIKPTDHLAFLVLEKNSGSICFIEQGIPKFIREFSLGAPVSEETGVSSEALNLKIVNEVGNSFDFYARQFNSNPIEQLLVSSEFVQKNLLEALEAELKLKVLRFSPLINTAYGPSSDIEAIYAMGACAAPSIDALSRFNFIEDKTAKPRLEFEWTSLIQPYKEIIIVFLLCVAILVGAAVFFQMQVNLVQGQYKQLTMKEGASAMETQDAVQAELQQNVDKLNQYKNIRTNSDMTAIILRLAAHLPKGSKLTELKIDYNQGDAKDAHVTIDLKGVVVTDGADAQLAVVDQLFKDFKDDKELARFVSNAKLVSLQHSVYNGKNMTGFSIELS